jgi:hypothetical protein
MSAIQSSSGNVFYHCNLKSPSGHHLYPNDSCIKESRYFVDSEEKGYNNSTNVKVQCFDCLAKEYCRTENCTNKKSKCECCKTSDLCSDCGDIQETTDTDFGGGYPFHMCKQCRPCKFCTRTFHKIEAQQCPTCGKMTCNIQMHALLDCGDIANIEKLKDCIRFLLKEIVILRQDMNLIYTDVMDGYCHGHQCQCQCSYSYGSCGCR